MAASTKYFKFMSADHEKTQQFVDNGHRNVFFFKHFTGF